MILLGAQQQASLVSPRVVENASIRALGRSGSLELGHEVWRFLGPGARQRAALRQAWRDVGTRTMARMQDEGQLSAAILDALKQAGVAGGSR